MKKNIKSDLKQYYFRWKLFKSLDMWENLLVPAPNIEIAARIMVKEFGYTKSPHEIDYTDQCVYINDVLSGIVEKVLWEEL